MTPLTEFDQEAINHLFATTRFDREEIEKAYRIFGIEFINLFFNKITSLGVTIDFALDKIKDCQEYHDIPANWHELPLGQKRTYVHAFFNWLTTLMTGVTDLTDQ